MRLKSLELQGYKSFALKSTFNFDTDGIVAVVGPNGSGKSNVADAIRWVLGEQSYSALRGQRTSDMIFAGSKNRPRMGMAYVSIVLDNSDGSLPLDYNEVTISRRAYRSGENEYLINNNRVRLKDVTEVLAKGGLARQTYTAIGQGTIDKVLSLRAEDRRQLFEEAAGITFHRRQRAAALKRLDETRSNLIRVNDIVKEIEPRLKRLRKQAERVEQHQKIRLHLDGLLKVWYGYQWNWQQERLHRARVRETISRERLKDEQQSLAEIEAKIHTLRGQQSDLRGQLGDWHAQSSGLHRQAEALQRDLAVGEERARHLAAQREEYLGEIEALKTRVKAQQQQVNQAQQALSQTEAELQSAEKTLQAAQKTLSGHRQKRRELQRQQQQAANRAQNAAHTLTQRQSRLQQLAERKEDLLAQQKTQQQAISSLQAQQLQSQTALQAAQEKLSQLQKARQALSQNEAALTQKHQTLLAEAQAWQAQQAEHEKTLASLQGRQDLLARLRNDLSGYHAGVKEILQAKTLPGIKGTVAQLIHVPAEFEQAIEAAIGGRLQDIVTNTWRDAESAIAHLKEQRAGRATLLPLDRLRPAPPLKAPNLEGVLGLGTALVSFEPEVDAAVRYLLNRTLLVRDLKTARKAFDKLKGNFQLVTPAGEIVRSGGAITGGAARRKNKQSGILAREREWRELPGQIKETQTRIRQLAAQLTQNAAARQKLEGEAADLTRQKNDTLRQTQNAQAALNRQQAALSELQNKIAWRKDLQQQAADELATNAERAAETQAEIASLREKQEQAAAEAETLQEQVNSLSAETLQNALNEAKNRAALIRAQQQNQRALLKTYTRSWQESQSQLQSRQGRAGSLAGQREALLARLETQQQEHIALVEAVSVFTTKIEAAESTLKQHESKQIGLEQQESEQRQLLRRLEAEHNRLSLELVRRQDELNALQREIEDDFGMVQFELSDDQIAQPVLPIQSLVTQLPAVEELPEGIEEDIRHLRLQLHRLGHINPEAPRDYTELQERYEFLSGQMADLEAAAGDLKVVIEELDKIMEEKFSQVFTSVAKEFQTYFKILFGGGEAQLSLTNPEDISNTGVEITARPPGKRAQSLDILSGGERSLTAQALIFALLKTSPTPYCVFDEVDAMLDEANVDRFRQALSDLGKDIQFIVITHNRKTIEIAKTIYGISMGDDAVSKIVSLKLEDVPDEAISLAPAQNRA